MPNKENNNQKILYDALTKDGYDLGSFDQFSEKVKDEANRKILYETISKDNWDVGDYDNFSQKLSGSVPESNPLEQPLHVEVPVSIRSANGLSGSNTTSAYTLPKTTESEPEDDRLFEENMQRMKEGKPLNRVTTQSVIDANPGLGLQGSSYQPTEEEIRSYTLRNKPGMFKNRTSSLIDKPLGDAAESVEGYGDKANARVDLLKKYYSGDEFKQRIKKETGARVTDLLEQTDADLNTINEKISARQKAIRNENWRPGMPSSRNDNTLVELRRQRTLLNNAENILDDSRKIVDEAGKKDSSWYESLGRGVRDKVFDVDSWTMGITDMAGSMNLNKVLEKADREEELDPAEQRLLDAAVTNMAVNAYYSSDLSAAYKAGQVTGESIPFMLEMAVNPISATGNATAKLLLKYGLKKFGQQIGKNVGKTIGAAAGMTATTGVPGVIGGAYDRMNGQLQFGLDDKGQLTYTGREGSMGTGEAFAKSAASRFLENHSEMVFNAFNGMGDVVWRGVQKIVPEGVNGFIQKAAGTGAGKMIRDWGNNETMKELAKRTQFHGIAGEYLEEVYNNLANVPLGEMAMDQVLDLDQNIDTFLGLAPTSVFFGVLGLGSMTAERIQHKKKMEAAFGNMTKVQRDKLAELERMSKQNGNADIRTFIKETMADPNLTREQKRQEIEYAYDIAVNNAFDEVAQEQAIEQAESRSSAQEEGTAAYASGDPSAVRESVVREEVSRERLEEVLPDIELLGRLYQADDAGRAEILGELPEEVRERAKEYLYSADKRQAVEDAIDEAHAPEVEAAEARVAEMTQHGRVTVVSLGKHGDATHTHGVVMNGLDENGSTTTSGGLIMVVPIDNGPAGLNFGTYDSANSKLIQMEVGAELVQMSPEDVTESMLGSYQEDVDNLQSTPILAGQRYELTDESGQSAVVEVQSFDMNGNVSVLVNGQPSVFPENQLQEMVEGSRRLAVEAEYAGVEAERQAVKDAAKKEAVSLETKRILPDGRLAVFSATNGEEVSYNIVDANGKIMESDMMPASEFEALNVYEPESSSMEEDSEDFEPQGEIGTKSEGSAKSEEIQPVSDGLPRKKDGTLDYDAFTPQQAYEYTSRTESPEVALEDLKSDIEESDRNLSSLREQLSSASRGKRISLRDTIRQAEAENQALKEFLNTVAPAATVMAEEEISRQAEEPAVEYPQAEAEDEEIKTIRLEDKPRKKYRPEKTKPFEATSDEMANSAVAQEILARTGPETLEELASVLLGNSIYLQMSGERATREMTGFGHKDLTPFLRMFRGKDKGGVTIEAAGDKLLEVARESYPEIIAKEGLENDNTGMAGTNAILSLIGQSRTFSDISGYIRKNRIAEAQSAMDAENEYNERMEEEWIWETYHTDKAGLDALDNGEAFSETNVHTEEEIVEFYNNFADEILKEQYYDRRNEGVHGQGIGESQTDDSRGVHGIREGSDNVLLQAQPVLSNGEEGHSGESGQVYGQSTEDVHRQNDAVQGSSSGKEIASQIESARAAVAANPTEAQKEAGNYKKGHVRIDGYEITIENPKGGVRSGTDRSGKKWSITMNNDYGYIRGTEAVDGDHIDVFLSDTPDSGHVFVVDQTNEDGSFDESKVMYGFNSLEEARAAYLSNYEKGWESRIMAITEVSKEEFRKWIASSHRKTKAFSEYKSVKAYGPSIESSNVSRMQDIENRLAEIEDRKIEISDLKRDQSIGRIELAYLLIEEQDLNIEQLELEAEYSGLRAMNDESNAISEAEGSDLRFRKSDEKEEKRRIPLRDRAKDWEKKLGVKVNIMESLDDVTNKDARRAIQRGAMVTGWFEESTGEVCLFMPYLESESEIDATYIHEVVAHKGLRGLLGDKFDSFLDKVWESMPEADRTKYLSYPGVNGDSRAAADEYIAHLAENVDVTESAWSKFTELFKKFLKAIGLEPKITDADIANTIKKSYQRLLEGGASEGAAGEGTRFSAKKKRALETASVSRGKHQPTVVSSADGANILNNLDNLAKEYEEKSSQSKTFLGDVANAIGAQKQGSGSQYATFETVNGNVVTIRLADHNATVSNFDNRDENEGISIVVSAKGNNGITNDGDAHIVEYFYDSIDLRRADGKPLAEIVKAIKQSLYSGEYKDTTGLAERQEVNESRFRVVNDKNGKKTLVGLHNISEEKLRKAIKQGGLANPSMAVIDMDKQSHVDYGDITLIAPSSLIDKKTGKNIGTYTADAWTPIYPNIEKRMSDKGAKVYSESLESVPSELRNKVRLYFNAYLEDGNTSGALNYWFLNDTGKNPPSLTSQSNDYTNEELDAIEAISNAGYYSGLNEEEKQKVLDLFIEKQGGKDAFDARISERIETMKNNLQRPDLKAFMKNKVEQKLQEIQEYGYDYEQVSNFYSNAQRAINNRGKIDEFRTFRNAQDIVNNEGLQGEFNEWLADKEEQFGVEEYLFVGYNNNGDRKYLPNTLENASKLMKKEGRAGATGLHGFNHFVATLAPNVGTLAQINKKKGNLSTQEEYDAFREKWGDVYHELAKQLQPDATGYADYGYYRLEEMPNVKNPKEYVKKEYGIELSDEFMKKYNEFVSAIKNDFPARYFETKFERPVYLNEFAAAVIPQGTSKEVVYALTEAGLPIEKYESGNNEARMAAVDKVSSEIGGIRFRFIGERGARNLDKTEEATTRLDNLAVAREMEASEKDAKTIKMATGWERGADGLWRYEVDDNIDFELRRPKKTELKKAYEEANEKYYKLEMRVPARTPKNATEDEKQRIKDMRKELAKLRKGMNKAFDAYYDYSAESATLGEFLGKDNQLFKEYPELADYGVSFLRDSKKLAEGLKGSFTPEYKVIWVDDSRPKGDIKSTLVHEIQHAIQGIEGFAQGGTPAAFASAKYQAEEWKANFNEFINRYGFEDWSKNLPVEDWMKYGKEYKGQFGGLHRAFIDNAVEDEGVKKTLTKELDYVKAAYDKFYQIAGGMDPAYKFKDANEWYRSLSGEVESRNVQQRMGMTDDQRRNTLAYETEDVAREDQIFLKDGIESGMRFRISEKGKQIQAEVDKFTAKYNSKPVVIVDSEMTDEELEEAIPESSAERTREEISSGYPGGYSPNTDKIYIFVDNQEMDDIEDTMFHENLHPLYNGSLMVEEFYNNAKEDKKTLIEALSEAYKDSEIPNEMFAHMIAKDMFKGDFKFAEKYLSEESRNGLFNTLKEFGYDRLEEESLRRRQGAVQRNVQMDREPQKTESVDGGLHEGKAISPRERKEQLGKLFDKVADMGLRGVLGDAEYDLLMRDIYNVLPKDVRSKIKDDAQEHYGGDFVPAMSDYLNIKGKSFVWDKIVGVFRETFRKIGIGLDFTQNDVKYLIWRNRNRINPYSVIDRAKDVDKRFSLKVGEFGDTESTIRFRVDGESSYESKIRNLEKAISRYESSDQIRKELIDLIDKELGSEFVGEITKQELRSLLLQVKNAKERRSRKANQAALVKILMNIQSVVLNARRRKYQRNLDRLLSLKVQDVNGKNMSIAKNVDDSTRKIFSYMKGRVADLKISGYDEDIQYLKKEIRGFNEQIQRLERQLEESKNSEKTKVQTEIDRILSKIDENKSLIEELKQLKADVEEAKLRQGDINIDREMKLLEEKMDDAAKGEATWTLGDSERLAALNIIQSLMLNKEKDYEVRTIEEEIEKLILNNSSLYKKLPSLTGDNREKINRQIEENRRQIAARTRLINDVHSLQVQQLQETIAQMNELIANGKNSLLKKIEDEAKRKSFLIGKALRSVEGKPVDIYDDKARSENWAKKFFSAPLGSFEYMAKRINTKTLGQDGFFYKYFVEGKEGVIEAENTYLKGMAEARRRLDEKTKEIFGKKFEAVWKNSDKVEKNSGVYVYDTFHQDPNGYGVKYEKPLSKGQAMYIYMAWKMTDGRTKLEVQGFDEESIAEIVDFIGDDYVKLADWIQEELLSDLREKYNEKYLQMYNTSMANIPNYVPLRIRKEAVRQESDLSEDKERKKTLEERAGSLINRVANTKPVDITMSAFDVIFDHIKQMEEWNAYARVRRDLDAILSNTDFRNQLNVNQRGSFENFYDAAAVATRSNRPDKAKYMDEVLGKLSKGIVGGNIAFRLNTALKQLLSAPAFFGYSQHPYFAGHLLKNVLNVTSWASSYRWAKENIPSFRERVESGTAGNEKLNDEAISKALDKYIEWGMIPNKLVDAFVCSVGAKSIYDFKYGRLKAAKVKEEEAKRQAVMEADIYYNATQQSSHPAFMSPVQMSRTFTDRMLTTYQNSNIGYVRRWLSAMYDIMRSLKWKDLKKNYTDMYMEQGLTRETAEAKAVARIFNENRKAIVTIALFSYGLNWLWDRGSQGLLGYTGGDDPEEEEKNPEEKLLKDFSYLVTTPIKGLPGGNLLVSLSEDYGMNPFLIYDEIESSMKEIKRAVDKYGLISPEIAYKALDLTTRIGGVDLEVWGNAYMGLEGAFRDGIGHEDDGIINLMLFLNSPKSQREAVAKNIYKDMSVLEYARAVQRAAKYVPKDDPWESWVPGVKEYSKRKESELKKEYKKRQNE